MTNNTHTLGLKHLEDNEKHQQIMTDVLVTLTNLVCVKKNNAPFTVGRYLSSRGCSRGRVMKQQHMNPPLNSNLTSLTES